jgi:hypothetical protein
VALQFVAGTQVQTLFWQEVLPVHVPQGIVPPQPFGSLPQLWPGAHDVPGLHETHVLFTQ